MKKNTSHGFTLIELMIVVAIVAIIAAIAIPSYQSQIQTTRRGAAAGCLLEVAQQMERRYTTNLSYVGTPTLPALTCITDQATNYVIDFQTGSPQVSTYGLKATAQASQSGDGCGNLLLNEKTVKSVSEGTATAIIKKCWK